jgi:hypothetical protein
MNEQLAKLCYEFLLYRDQLRDGRFFHSYRQLYPLCAYICMIRHQEPNDEIVRLCREILREYAGFFSMFRGNGEEVMVTLLSCETDPGACMELCDQAYSSLRSEFHASHYLPLLAYYMATSMPAVKFDEFTYRTRELYDTFNNLHPFLTSEEDSLYMGLLTASGRDPRAIAEEAEEIYEMLAGEFPFHKNPIHSLSHALTLCPGAAPAKAARFRNLFRELRDMDYRYGKDYELIALGILANMGYETEQIMEDFINVDRYLADSDGYGWLGGFSRRTRYLHAVLILSVYYHNGSSELTAAMIVSVLMEIQAEQAAAAAAAA